jgi:hypothetical protein
MWEELKEKWFAKRPYYKEIKKEAGRQPPTSFELT